MSLSSSTELITQIPLVGYYDGPECVVLKFYHQANQAKIQYRVVPLVLKLDVPMGYGSDAVWDKLLLGSDDDPVFAKYRPSVSAVHTTIVKAVEIARNCVLAHYEPAAHSLDPDMCATIGGKVRVAQITRTEGFKWAD